MEQEEADEEEEDDDDGGELLRFFLAFARLIFCELRVAFLRPGPVGPSLSLSSSSSLE